MASRSLQQVLSELDSVYKPQIQNLRTRQAAIPSQMQAEEAGLKAKEQDYFDNTILAGARRRGLGFAGIPEGERARYGATEYMPALARLRQQSKEQAMSLEDAILGINERRMGQGQSIYQFEQQAAEQRRQFDEQMRESRRQAAIQQANQWQPSNGYIAPGSGTNNSVGNTFAQQREDGGFNFRDPDTGASISAAMYAAKMQVPFRQVLQDMANAGDKGASRALGFVGNDFGYDPRKVLDKSTANLYNNLVWGVRPNISAPKTMTLPGVKF